MEDTKQEETQDDCPEQNQQSNESQTEVSGRGRPSKSNKRTNIVLVGMTGSGKSTTGWLLSKQMGYGFLDLDSWIEKLAGKKISVIFQENGEKGFREKETDALKSFFSIQNHVVAVGAGAVIDDQNWDMIKSLGTVVWIDCPTEELVRRMNKNPSELQKRPLLADVAAIESEEERSSLLRERLGAVLGQRKSRYDEAGIVLRESFSTAEDTARRLGHLVSRRRKSTSYSKSHRS